MQLVHLINHKRFFNFFHQLIHIGPVTSKNERLFGLSSQSLEILKKIQNNFYSFSGLLGSSLNFQAF